MTRLNNIEVKNLCKAKHISINFNYTTVKINAQNESKSSIKTKSHQNNNIWSNKSRKLK